VKEAEQECLRRLRRKRNLIALVFGFQTMLLLLHVYMVTLRPIKALGSFTMMVMLLIAHYQWWSWTRWNAKVRAYKKVLRLADEGREASGNLKVHKHEQLEAALAEANKEDEWLALRPATKDDL
jgi:hypothetical protein